MKRTLMATAAALALAAPSITSASSIRVDDGRDIIRKGDPASKLGRYLGGPNYSEIGKVCKKPSTSLCKRDNNTTWGRIYQYHYDGRYYTVHVNDGTITYIDSSR